MKRLREEEVVISDETKQECLTLALIHATHRVLYYDGQQSLAPYTTWLEMHLETRKKSRLLIGYEQLRLFWHLMQITETALLPREILLIHLGPALFGPFHLDVHGKTVALYEPFITAVCTTIKDLHESFTFLYKGMWVTMGRFGCRVWLFRPYWPKNHQLAYYMSDHVLCKSFKDILENPGYNEGSIFTQIM